MKNLKSKSLVAVILIVLIGASVVTSAENINIVIEREIEEPLDANLEIITFIEGFASDVNKKGIGIMIHREVEMWSNTVHGIGLTIKGIRQPFEEFELDVDYIKAPIIIGLIWMGVMPGPMINCIALGDIEWS